MNANSKENYIPLSTIYGKPNPDGTYALTALDIKNLNDNLYAIAKKIQGGLTFADMTKEVNQEYTSMAGDITQVRVTAEGASITASNAYGKAQQVELTVDGLRIENAQKNYTVIDGDRLKSYNHSSMAQVKIEDGVIDLSAYGGSGSIRATSAGVYVQADNGYLYLMGDVQLGMYGETNINGNAIRIASGGNMSINSSGKTFIATNSIYSGDVDIGQAGGTINLRGNVLVNGVPIGGA